MALAAAGYGVKKGVDASEKNSEAERIVRNAESEYDNAKDETESKQSETNFKLEELGRLKLNIFNQEMKYVVDMAGRCKKAKSKFEDESFNSEELQELSLSVNNSLEIASGIASGATAGALTGLGAYGAVGYLASASTGTAIAGLSGAAATNATLAWLGGGAIATGGGGMALGTAVLGGIVAGPLIAVGGMFMDSKAEENLTEAKKVRREAKKAAEEMRVMQTVLDGIQFRIEELTDVLNVVLTKFNDAKYDIDSLLLSKNDASNQGNESNKSDSKNFLQNIGISKKENLLCETNEFRKLMMLGKSLKQILDLSILTENGSSNTGLTSEISNILEHNS